MGRICIVPKDIARLTGKSERSSRLVYAKIMKHYKKEKHQVITINELCEYLDIKDIESVRQQIK